MKYSLHWRVVCLALIIIPMLTGCSSRFFFTSGEADQDPGWYHQLIEKPGRLIGYGKATTAEAAKAQALKEISEKISVNVESKTRSIIEDLAGDVISFSSQQLSLVSRHRLMQAKNLKVTSQSGIYYSAWQVDLRPTVYILAEELIAANGGQYAAVSWRGSPLIVNSPLIKKLTMEITADHSSSGNLSVFSLSLYRRQQSWWLSAGGNVHLITGSELIEILDWNFKQNDHFKITAASGGRNGVARLSAGENFSLSTALPDSYGYLSLFNIYSDGRVTLMQDSIPVTQQHIVLGNHQDQWQLQAQPLHSGKTDYDTYLAIWSRQQLNNTRFVEQKDYIVSDSESYKLPELFRSIESKNTLSIASIVIEVTP